MTKIIIPRDSLTNKNKPHSHILVSTDFNTNNNLIILIPDKVDYPVG
jgi:hypothetical protein